MGLEFRRVLFRSTVKLLLAQDIKDRFNAVGMEARAMSPTALATYMKSEIAKWGRVVKASGARPE